jgi:hypothetical protein
MDTGSKAEHIGSHTRFLNQAEHYAEMSGSRSIRPNVLIQIVAAFAVLCLGADKPGEEPLREKPIRPEDRAHWAFVSPKKPEIPATRETNWIRNPIDSFILAKLEEAKLPHSPEADRATLLRRLSFDLTGLPPSPEELDAFLSDGAPTAYERQVERLLASPQYGVRWAQHWLDLARYADTDGFEFDQARPDAWRYRDWVAAALNDDVPYNVFIRRQLAGDETEPNDPSSFIATGFTRCYPDMVDLNDQGLRRQNALNDITETTGLVFLGLTIGCARCHDHKFDPIRQSDFYRLQAFFSPARFRDDYPIASPEQRKEHEQRMRIWEPEIASIQSALMRVEAPARAKLAPGLPPNVDELVIAASQKSEADRSVADVRLIYEAFGKDKRIKPADLERELGPDASKTRSELRERLDRTRKAAPPSLPLARGVDEPGTQASPTYLLRRGEFTAKGPEISPAFPAVLTESAPEIVPTAHSTGRRAALAAWLTHPDHPLTGRVIVNRLWQHHFGRGLVATPSDFGTLGEAPTHPELLDWLASELVRQDWSLKTMHRLMVNSTTYRQSSGLSNADVRLRPNEGASSVPSRSPNQPAVLGPRPSEENDPENTLLWRFRRQRLDGEAIRDALLAVSGQLNLGMGGPSVFPELPSELTKLSSKGAIWPVSPQLEDRRRRSLYIFVRRNLRFPFFEAFDRPDTNASCPQRPVTTIAPQALSLLNSTLAQDSACALVARADHEAGLAFNPRIRLIYRLTLGREPDEEELELATEFLGPGQTAQWMAFALTLLNINEFVYID